MSLLLLVVSLAGAQTYVAPPVVRGAPAVVAEEPGDDDDKHSPLTHMRLTAAALDFYRATQPASDLDVFKDQVVSGAHDEDKSGRNPFGQIAPELRHFWNPDGGDYDGILR